MAQFIAFRPDAEVSGDAILSVVEGMGAFSDSAQRILTKNQIVSPKKGDWFSQQSWLNAFKEISEKIGYRTLNSIGKKIPETAKWPAEIKTIESALASIDVAFHMNHRINGKILFDPQTGLISKGIGHYYFEKIGDKHVKMICDNSYPCDFDMGIIQATANKFKEFPNAVIEITHDITGPCRKYGSNSCIYIVKW